MGWLQGWFGKKAKSEDMPAELAVWSDDQYEAFFFELLGGVHRGWNRERVMQYLGSRSMDERMVGWLRRVGKKRMTNHEVAELLVKLGELNCGEIGAVSLEIGRALLAKSPQTDPLTANESLAIETEPESIAPKSQADENVEVLYQQGLEYFQSGNNVLALECFERVIALKPDDPDVWYNLGVVLQNLGRYEEAIASNNKYIALAAKATKIENRKVSEPAKSLFAIDTQTAETWFNQGNEQVMAEDFLEAIASYDRALQINPNDHGAWFNRGICLYHLQRYEEAIASFDCAIQFKPDDHGAWNVLGGILCDHLQRYEEAIASFDRAIQIKPDFHEAWFNRGNSLAYLQRYEEAIASFAHTIQIKPDDHQAWYARGNSLADLQRYEEAIASYDRAIQIKPDDHQAWSNQGNSLAYLQRYEEAIASFDCAIQFKPDNHQAWSNQGNSLADLQRYEEAIASFDCAIQFKPDFHQAWVNRGSAAGASDGRGKSPLIFSLPLDLRNPELDKRGYEGRLACYGEGLKYVLRDLNPEGWGKLHQAIGDAHYYKGRREQKPLRYWRMAVGSFETALQALTAEAFPEIHLEVLLDLIRAYAGLGNTTKVEGLLHDGTSLLQRLLRQEKRSDWSKEQLIRKFSHRFSETTVDFLVQTGKPIEAIETAERNKNAFLTWLLDTFRDPEDIPSPNFSQIQSLLTDSTTAIIYWHISASALTTFIITPNAPAPILLTTPGYTAEIPESMQRLLEFETWATAWQKQYADYRGDKKNAQGLEGEERKKSQNTSDHPWRIEMTAQLEKLREILNIDGILQQLSSLLDSGLEEEEDLRKLILIPHRDLHLFPLHCFFSDRFTVTYLPSAQVGLSQQPVPHRTNSLLNVGYPASDGLAPLAYAQLESSIIGLEFVNATEPVFADRATKKDVTAKLQSNYNIFHFTGHGLYNFHDPKQSALFLAGSDRLTMADICQIDLASYRLVTLSACETAIASNQTISNEYVGLVSAFLRGKSGNGADRVVSTLWTVESVSSMLLMSEFYALCQAGDSEATALAKAIRWMQQLTALQLVEKYRVILAKFDDTNDPENGIRPMLKSEIRQFSKMEAERTPFNHPYNWAAFTIAGHF